jgi:hypothetical protein
VIDPEFGREDHGPGGGWNHLIPELTLNQIQLVVKTKKIK